MASRTFNRMDVSEPNVGDEEDTLLSDEPSDVREVYVAGSRGRWLPLAVAAVLGLAALAGLSAASRTSEQPVAPQPRLLESEDLMGAILDHALRFHHEFTGEHFDASGEETQASLKAHVREKIQETVTKVTGHSSESGRALADMRLTPVQWRQSKQILEALHDKRVQEMGQFVQKLERESGSLEEAQQRLAAKGPELRQLHEELIPKALQDPSSWTKGPNQWGFSLESGRARATGTVGGWKGELVVGGGEESKQVARRLGAGELIYLIITGIVSLALGITSIVLSATVGGATAAIFFFITVGMDVALCGTDLALTRIPALANKVTWIPCALLTAFTGLEAIWTYIMPWVNSRGATTLTTTVFTR